MILHILLSKIYKFAITRKNDAFVAKIVNTRSIIITIKIITIITIIRTIEKGNHRLTPAPRISAGLRRMLLPDLVHVLFRGHLAGGPGRPCSARPPGCSGCPPGCSRWSREIPKRYLSHGPKHVFSRVGGSQHVFFSSSPTSAT